MNELKIHKNITINKLKVPGTDKKVYIIDNFLHDLDSILNFAYNIAYFNPMFSDNSFYPGIRDHMPQPYLRILKTFFLEHILPDLGSQYNEVKLHRSLLSLVTCKPEQLIIQQKMPHIDTFDQQHYAFVHYLSQQDFGGTSLYKYKPDNIIEFHEEHSPILEKMVNDIKNTPEEHSGYINNSTSIFERVLKVDAKPNRLVIYQGNLLHSANILLDDNGYNKDPKCGRLAISSFATLIKG
ncbi:hypothetical protein PSECIP111854_01992 [Pseudoalteromonas sp. CIP111854]|uniref:Uncharacterized protein n=1 Tax=Pseudoalteromonas holothuriae TaxID=2963714 RepID=A0A9W4QXB8_9GAMM|nr:DUF6445 family protein [Pseudoalteromonas sp. CIP111854]CAH9057417.1 hypothetical protein PSECIP111854_01992 [Pseudoalteromonas sp. CIP111854]